MSKIGKVTKPAFPAPPINARKMPEAQGIGNEPKEEAVRAIPEEAPEVKTKAVRITDEEEDEEVKVYVPNKTQNKKSRELFSRRSRKKQSVPENYDIEEIPDEPENRNLGVWITVIAALVVMCIGAGALYAFVNGYFDGIIKLL